MIVQEEDKRSVCLCVSVCVCERDSDSKMELMCLGTNVTCIIEPSVREGVCEQPVF